MTKSSSELTIEQERPLAPLTSLGLGGSARYFVQVDSETLLVEALRWAKRSHLNASILGGGSNLVVADRGVEGLVLRMATRGIDISREGPVALVTAQAGESLQTLVDLSLDEDLAGLECLTGIPGSVGATPIQNVGAYGQEIADSLRSVRVLDRQTLSTHTLPANECGFAYRTSQFKRDPERYVVLSVTLALVPGGAPNMVYPELARALSERGAVASLREVARTVWALRAAKSMLLDPADENGRSAGSFFTNPIVSLAEAERVKAHAVSAQMVTSADEVPCFEAGATKRKLSAGWLIERAGIRKGMRRGNVGVSSRHALALVHHGGGTTAELLALASEIEGRVRDVFGIQLEMEPVRWG